MALDKGKVLHLGSARVRVGGRFVGQVSDFRIERDVSKAEHMTNVELEFRRDYVLPLETRVGLGWTFGEIQPFAANMLLGMPGYRSIPLDRRLSSAPLPVRVWGAVTPMVYQETPVLDMSAEGYPTWQPLTYPMIGNDIASVGPPPSVVARNISSPTATPTVKYVGFVVSTANTAGAEKSIGSTPAIVGYDDDSVVVGGDTIELRVALPDTGGVLPGDGLILLVHRFAYEYNTTTQSLVCTPGQSATDHLYDFGANDWYACTLTDVQNGYAIVTVQAEKALVAGMPIDPCTCKSWDGATTYTYLEDFEVIINRNGSSYIKRSPGTDSVPGAIAAGEMVVVDYYYNAADIAEAPIGTSGGENPVVGCNAEVLFPDNQSKLIFNVWRMQVNTSMSFATSERDWTGIPFAGDTLDASDVYPDYPYGYMQVVGPLARRILEGGNRAVLNGEFEQNNLGNRTTWS